MKKSFLILFLVASCFDVFSQTEDFQIGSQRLFQSQTGGYYDYSKSDALNMNVSVWGFVKFPGRYLIPSSTSADELLSFSGGPTDDANLDDLRLFRTLADSTEILIKFDLEDLWWGDDLERNKKYIPNLQVHDILVVPGSRRLYFDDWARLGLSFISAIISVATFIIVLNQ